MQKGDLVQYQGMGNGQGCVGLVIEIDSTIDDSIVLANTRVRWTDHTGYEREWYRKDELVRLNKRCSE